MFTNSTQIGSGFQIFLTRKGCIPITSWPKKVQNLEVNGVNGCSRHRKTWEHMIMEDLHVKGLRKDLAQNHAEWRFAIT